MSDLPPQLDPANPVQDPVHGRVWLTALEIELVNTPEFQRLRRIAQLAPADLVFPGATHNRFAHSIGATHVMGWILRQQTMQDYFVGRSDRGDYIQLIRVAALLHDIGHLPYSHVGEIAWTLHSRGGLKAYRDDEALTVFDLAATGKRAPLHEELSVALVRDGPLAEIINRHIPGGRFGGRTASEVVADIIEGTEPDAVIRNLLSSDLDCDRLDYLVRDSMAAGLVYGQADLSYLIGSLVVCERDGDAVLGIDERHGLLAGEHYLLARYYHYAQFITHKTIGSAEVTLVAAILELLDAGELLGYDELQETVGDKRIGAFLALTDAAVEAKLSDVLRTGNGSDELREAARRLLTRRLMKTAGRNAGLEEERRPGEPFTHPWDSRLLEPDQKRAFAEQHGIDPTYFCFSRTENSLSGVAAAVSPSTLGPKTERGVQKAAKVGSHGGDWRLLIDASGVLAHLSRHLWVTRRIYAREDPSGAGNYATRSDAFRALRGALDESAG